MKTADLFLRILAACMICALATRTDAAKKEGPPTVAFPEVDFRDQSSPRFATLSIDPFTNRVVHLAFDGNVTDGYNKVWVWTPGERDYDPPKVFTSTSERNFKPISFESKQERKTALVQYALRWAIGRSGGTHTSKNYVTGETTTRTTKVTTYPYFDYSCTYGRGEHAALRGPGQYPLHVVIPGRISVTGVQTNLPVAYTPWQNLHFTMGLKPIHGAREEDRGLIFTGNLWHHHHSGWRVDVKSLPESAAIKLAATPYLESPVYEEELTYEQAFDEGVRINLPYGWYGFTWSFTCDGVGINSYGQKTGRWTYPFAMPSPAQ